MFESIAIRVEVLCQPRPPWQVLTRSTDAEFAGWDWCDLAFRVDTIRFREEVYVAECSRDGQGCSTGRCF